MCEGATTGNRAGSCGSTSLNSVLQVHLVRTHIDNKSDDHLHRKHNQPVAHNECSIKFRSLSPFHDEG